MPPRKKVETKESHISKGLADLRIELQRRRLRRWNPEAITPVPVSSVVLEYLLDMHDQIPAVLDGIGKDFDQVVVALKEAAALLRRGKR